MAALLKQLKVRSFDDAASLDPAPHVVRWHCISGSRLVVHFDESVFSSRGLNRGKSLDLLSAIHRELCNNSDYVSGEGDDTSYRIGLASETTPGVSYRERRLVGELSPAEQEATVRMYAAKVFHEFDQRDLRRRIRSFPWGKPSPV